MSVITRDTLRAKCWLSYVLRCSTLVILMSTAGCFRPAFKPEGAAVVGRAAMDVCESLNKSRPTITSLRVLADATISSGSDSASLRYVVLSKDPKSFRVDVLPDTGAFTLGLLVAHHGKALWLNAQEKTYAQDSDERKLVGDYLGLRRVSREAAVALMTGVVPQLPCSHVRVYDLGNSERVVVDEESHIAWRIAGDSPRVVGVQVLDDEGDSVEMQGEVERRGADLPTGLTLSIFSPASAQVGMVLRRVVLNPALSDRLFEVQPPSDYTRLQ